MVLLARAVGQAPKKRAVAMGALLHAGIGSAAVATQAAAALGGGHAVSVWSAGAAADDDADDEAASADEWAQVCDALVEGEEYGALDLPTRCQVVD